MGAGRTETTRAIFGVDPKESGTLILDGKEITINNPMDAIKAGVVLAPKTERKTDYVQNSVSVIILHFQTLTLSVEKAG